MPSAESPDIVLERMRGVEGWLEDDEALLLMEGLSGALRLPEWGSIVELGSWKGRSTAVLASIAKEADEVVWAVDPHRGEISNEHGGTVSFVPSAQEFQRNMEELDLDDTVMLLRQKATEVDWDRPIAFLLHDALHDYESVSCDFRHYEPWLIDGAYVAFHDYAPSWPGVWKFVQELSDSRKYRIAETSETGTMVLLQKGGGSR